MSEVISYLESKGIEYTRPETSEAMIVCPVCGKQKLSINTDSGMAQCWVCKAEHPNSWTVKCHINRIKEEFGDILTVAKPGDMVLAGKKKEEKTDKDFTDLANEHHKRLLETPKAQKYLFKRGISEDSIDKFKLGYAEIKGQGWISIPAIEDKIIKLIKYRQLPPVNKNLAKCERAPGGKSVLFNGDALDEYDEVFVLEGEIDTITLIQSGYPNTVGITVGAGTLETEWYDKLILMDKIYIVFDADSVGQSAAKNVYADRIGIDKCWNVVLPEGEDVNSFFMNNTKEDFDKYVEKAERFRIEGVMNIKQAIREMYRMGTQDEQLAFETPWPLVNNLLGGGLKKKHLLILGGQGGAGKTTLALQIAYHFAVAYKIPSFTFCLEMTEVDLLTKIIQLKFDLLYEDVSFSDAHIFGSEISDLPLFFGYKSNIKFEMYYNTVKQLRDRYGCQLFIFDNLHRWIASDVESEYAKAVQSFKNLAMDLNVMMLLVMQPRKLNEGTTADINTFTPTYDDLKGSSAFSQEADEVLLIHRHRMSGENTIGSFMKKTHIINDKARFAVGGRCLLHFETGKSRFYNITDTEVKSLYEQEIEKLKAKGIIT